MRTPILSIAGASILVIIAGCKTPVPTHFDLGVAAENSGDRVEALRQFEESVRLEPVHKHAWRHIGYIKADKQGGKDYTKEVRDAILTFLMLETYEIGNVAGDKAYGIPETPVEPHLARRMVRACNAVIHKIEQIEADADVCYREFVIDPSDGELKQMALDSQGAALDANMGVSPKAHYMMGEILRRSGDDGGAKGHYETALQQSKDLKRANLKAQAGAAITGGDLDEGWLAVRELNKRELYGDFIEACIKRNELDRAVMAGSEARGHYADARIWRLLAEAHLLKDETANASKLISTLEKWPGKDMDAANFLRLCWAALSGAKTAEFAKKLESASATGNFDPSRLAAKVDGSKADGAAKSAVKKAADKMTAK
ncbi:MAG: hypothetical protein FD180_105 [Planctomycetota bacterium]|nr:MAG: hypothetical protein FD180_105 [Planctomycetota bacterium]